MTNTADHKPTIIRASAHDDPSGAYSFEEQQRRAQAIADLEQFKISMGTWVEDSKDGRACAQLAKAHPPDATEDALPSAINSLKKTSKGWLWPPRGTDAATRILEVTLRRVIEASEDGGNGWEYIFNFMARDMLANGRKPWPTDDFRRAYNRVLNRIEEKEQVELKVRNSVAGRKSTDKTGRVALIMETLGVGRRNAYYIEQDGTSNFEDRKALAAAFRDDPKRCFPGAWELTLGGRRGRPRGRPTLANYVLSGDADFESYPSFDALRTACKLGALPDGFKNLDGFLATLEPCGIPAEHALQIWRIGGPWRERNWRMDLQN